MKNSEECLQIVLITYNREQRLRETLEQLFSPDSPVKDFDITIQDNDSTDGTRGIVEEFSRTYPNLRYRKNNVNVGGNANICKALESVSRDYLWVLCDDDVFSWDGWNSVEDAMFRGEDLICVSNGFLAAGAGRRDSRAHILLQMSFLPSIIFSRRILSSTAIRNAYDSSFSLFPHLAPVVVHFNHGGSAFVTDKWIVFAGGKPGDGSYGRGSVKSDLINRTASMTMSVGMANVVSNLKDRKLARYAYGLLTRSEWIGGRKVFYGSYFYNLRGAKNKMNRTDIWMQSDFRRRLALLIVRTMQVLFGWMVTPRIYEAVRAFVDRHGKRT